MVVAADPLGDFNATSQILRYSALAREVTVPRVPSLSESIISSSSGRDRSGSGRMSPNGVSVEEFDRAVAEITRLTKDCHGLAVRLAEEEIARSELESRLVATEDRCVDIEQEVREECWAEMDEMMEAERKRWQKAWDEQVRASLDLTEGTNADTAQIGRNDEHVDRKIELVSRGFNSKGLPLLYLIPNRWLTLNQFTKTPNHLRMIALQKSSMKTISYDAVWLLLSGR